MTTDRLETARAIIAEGCGCDRQWHCLTNADVYCGCRKDAEKILSLPDAPAAERVSPESPATRVVRFVLAMTYKTYQDGDNPDADMRPLIEFTGERYREWKRRGHAFDEAHRESMVEAVAMILTDYPDLPTPKPSA